MPIQCDITAHEPLQGFDTEKHTEGEWEIIESETGALTRQVIDGEVAYSMPHYIRYHVRDRESWEFYRDRMTPGARWSDEKIDDAAKMYADRDKPLAVPIGGTWGPMRELMGPERAMTVLYDDPTLAGAASIFFAARSPANQVHYDRKGAV